MDRIASVLGLAGTRVTTRQHTFEVIARDQWRTLGSSSTELKYCTEGGVQLITQVKAKGMGLTFYQTFSYVVCHLEDIPADCIARVV